MKYFFSLLTLVPFCFFTKNISAQNFLVRAGLITSGSSTFEYKNTTDDWDFKIDPGFHFGIMIEFPVSNLLVLETGLLLSSQNRELVVTNTNNGRINRSRKANTSLIFPLAAKVFIPIGKTRFFGSLGPYLGNYLRTVPIIGIETEIDYGLLFGTGIEIGRFQFGINYAFGIPEIPLTNKNVQTIKNRTVSVFAAYKILAKSSK